MTKLESEKLVDFRNNIIKAMKTIEDRWVTSDGVRSKLVFEGLESEDVSLERVGNNLRILKDEGIVADTKIRGERCWSLTGNKFNGQPIVMVTVAFPKDVHEGIKSEALRAGLSRTAYIVKTVRDGLSL